MGAGSEETAAMDIAVPEYINDRLILKSIVNGLGVKRPRIVERHISRATANGDNYMSDVFRIAVRYADEDDDGGASGDDAPTHTLSLVVKSLPNTGQRGPIIEEMQAYEKEVCMFQEVVPKLTRMTNGTFFAARCFFASDLPERLLVFEDLKTLGYVTVNRQAGLDFEHCALVMQKIGQFHAASMLFAEQQPDMLRRQFNFNMFNPAYDTPSEHIRTIFEKGLEALIEVARNQWDGFDQTIVEKLEKLVPLYVDRMRDCLQQDSEADGGYCVLNHGDLWSNNMMFRYGDPDDDDGDGAIVQDVAFVDLQISFYSSPGVDLNYALANCPNYDTRPRLDELIELYHAAFKETLQQLRYDARPIPTLEDVRREIRRMEFFALVSVVSVLPIVLMDQTDELVANFDSLVGTDAEKARQIQYNGVNYQRIVRPMLIEFNQRKLLDV